jgi:hypothetical protein
MSDNIERLRQQSEQAVNAALSQASNGTSDATGGQPWNPWLVSFLTLIILAFSGFVLHYMRSMLKDGHSPGDILRLATMPMVITAAIFLVLLGYSNEQMTPVIGLLGTMIGYVLGSATPRGATPSKPDSSTHGDPPVQS